MPLYEYECCRCGTRFEALIQIAEREREEKKLACPQCSRHELRRLLSPFATPDASPAAHAATSGEHSCRPGG